ncbi:MAG: hypothetical protein ABI321_05750 [Polyangia bacterium]
MASHRYPVVIPAVIARTRTLERAGIDLLVAGGVVAAVDIGLWAAWRKK